MWSLDANFIVLTELSFFQEKITQEPAFVYYSASTSVFEKSVSEKSVEGEWQKAVQ